MGIRTARLTMPDEVPEHIAERSQHIQLAKPLSIYVPDVGETGLELIFRNYLTGSLYKLYKAGKDPYGLHLPEGLNEWHKFDKPIFTPTTKGTKDEPLNSNYVRKQFPDIINKLEKLFISFSKYSLENGIVVVDTKFEVFINSDEQWVLGDEILTPESSRFIAKKDFEKQNYISMDKQILRDFAKLNNWKEKAKNLIAGEKLDVDVPDTIKQSILNNYEIIREKLSK
jgi:phosphoribosylaminoimidazole-succinocarboxamide synthase